MEFNSIIYGIFLIIFISFYWLIGSYRNQLKSGIILVFSLIFYTALQVEYIPLLLVITLINFGIGQAIADNIQVKKNSDQLEEDDQYNPTLPKIWNRRGSKILALGITLNILLLISFKYIPFLLNSIAAIGDFKIIENNANWLRENLIAPLGISFFTFECIAYLIDVYRGAPVANKLLEFASYKLFFPKLISGPITRYHYFSHQIETQRIPVFEQWTEGLWLIASGAVKKVIIADHLGIFVDLSFGNLERASSTDLWLTTIAYGMQLYLDFSGYVDLARGSAKLIGLNLPENFNFPYFSTSIADFWRRWHITLGDWLRNYLYFPLGGSRQGLFKTCLNLLIVMLIAGIWHGAAWGYVIWGAFHGIALMIHRLADALSDRYDQLQLWWNSIPGIVVAWIITQVMVFTTWICFRLPNFNQALLVYQRLWNYPGDIQFIQKVYIEALGVEQSLIMFGLIILIALMGLLYWVQKFWKLQLNWPLKLALIPLCFYGVWLLAPEGSLPYIYFDF
jgi:alginate O-acetyltransferase complex protein AlgI